MGLDTTHGAWHGAYSAFGRWRQTIARAAGYAVWDVIFADLNLNMSDGRGYGTPTVMIDWGHVTDEQLAGKWEQTPSDPLLVLIAHHDDAGVIRPEQAGPLADRLEGLLPTLEQFGDLGGHVGNLRAKTERFVTGLRAALAAGEPLEFH